MIAKVFDLLGTDRKKHAYFLNSLSVLEYAGARKIMKSQKAETVSAELLAHMSEEIRHARLLKSLALQLSEGALTSYEEEHLLNGEETWNYIQSIDAMVEKDLAERADPWLNYVYTTLLIEERAMEVYPAYEPILKSFGFSNPLAGLIAEEEHHLIATAKAVTRADSESSARLSRLKKMEQLAFDRFINGVCHTLESDQKRVTRETFSPHSALDA